VREVYIRFAYLGWAWLVVAMLLVWWRISVLKKRAKAKGFEVVRRDE
jgi:hypothetical protein